MADQLYLAVDCSTTAAKAVVFDATGRAVASARRPLAMSRPHPGWHEQDAEQWWDASRAAMVEAIGQLEHPARVVAVCFTHQRESFVCLDAEDRPLRPAVLWVEPRATREIAELGSARVAEVSGKPPDVTPALYKLAWLRRHEPQVLDAAVRVGDVHAYLALRATGRWASAQGSADSLALFDLAALDWSAELLEVAGVRRAQLPELVPAGESIGQLLPAVAAEIGLPGPIPLVAGIGDGQAAGLGCGASGADAAYLNLGTSMVAGVQSPRYVTDPAFRTLAGGVQGTYVLEILVNSAGYLTDWFRQGFAAGAANSDLDAAAAAVPPGCDGLLTLPYWNAVQSPYWDANARGATVGWHGGHTPAHLYRSLLEGVAYELRFQLAGLERVTGQPVRVLHAVGGGTRSPVWTQIIADVTGRTVRLGDEQEVHAKGAAVIAPAFASGAGNAGIDAAASELASAASTIAPDRAPRAAYDHAYQAYVGLYPGLRASFRDLAAAPDSRPASSHAPDPLPPAPFAG